MSVAADVADPAADIAWVTVLVDGPGATMSDRSAASAGAIVMDGVVVTDGAVPVVADGVVMMDGVTVADVAAVTDWAVATNGVGVDATGSASGVMEAGVPSAVNAVAVSDASAAVVENSLAADELVEEDGGSIDLLVY